MTKHVPSFKHLIASSSTRAEGSPSHGRERSVNDRLQSSRARQHAVQREGATLLAAANDGERIWSIGEGTGNLGGAPIPGEGGVHPAELLRRSQVAHRQALRSVAGPAPPMSWRSQHTGKYHTEPGLPRRSRLIIVADLRRSAELFTEPLTVGKAVIGTPRLVEICYKAILNSLASDASLGVGGEEDGAVLGDVMREQVGYLASHLKAGLLETGALLVANDPSRFSDKSIRSILSDPSNHQDDDWEESTVDSDGIEWDESQATLHHLPLTSHTSPISLLRQVPTLPLLALSSLNLAYSTLNDLDRLVAVLPSSLRELSLCGVRLKGGEGALVDGDAWRRALGAMGRKLIVLTMLDLSEPPLPPSTITMAALLHPPTSRLPSLRLLGLRGVAEEEAENRRDVSQRKQFAEVIRGEGRHRYIDIRWR